MRLAPIYSVIVVSAFTHRCDTNTFSHSLTRINLLQLKIYNIWMKIFETKKFSI